MTDVPTSATASALQSSTNVGERAWKRRHQVRTGVCGTSRCSAIGRRPTFAITFTAISAPDDRHLVKPSSGHQVRQQRMRAPTLAATTASNPDAFGQQRRA